MNHGYKSSSQAWKSKDISNILKFDDRRFLDVGFPEFTLQITMFRRLRITVSYRTQDNLCIQSLALRMIEICF